MQDYNDMQDLQRSDGVAHPQRCGPRAASAGAWV
jgi:hypothetical protein